MRLRLTLPFALFATASACGSVPDDPGARIFPAQGVIRGSVLYQGPRPCSSNGHIVGAAILFVFDRRNPPPPNGLATLPVNFGVVTGDALFPNEPRYTGTDIYCPLQAGFTETITVTAPFAISPMSGGSFMIQSFYDYTGDFLPTFKFRQLPERGDIGGGDIDTADALKAINAGNPNYSPRFLEVNVGIPRPLQSGQTIPTYDIPSTGYVADNVAVTLGESLPFTRPYLWAQGTKAKYIPANAPTPSGVDLTISQDSACPHGQANPPNCGANCPTTCPTGNDDAIANTAENDDNYKPILTIPQDLKVFSPPSASDPDGANIFDAGFPHIRLVFGVPDAEKPCATSGSCSQSIAPGGANPYHFQLDSTGFNVYENAFFNSETQKWTPLQIPEGGGLPMLWPLVILSKLVDNPPDPKTGAVDTLHGNDPASLTAQGDATHPVVIMQGITLLTAQPNINPLAGAPAQADTILNTVLAAGPSLTPGGPPVFPNALFNYATGQPCAKWDSNNQACVADGPMVQDHLMVALRPSVICFNHLFDNPLPADTRGVLVSPYSSNAIAAGAGGGAPGPIVPVDLLSIDQKTNVSGDPQHPMGRFPVTNLVNSVKYGCLPKGRYAINVVYPDGQAWTVPNEAGACVGGSEGTTDFGSLTCQIKPRPVLYSQGNRAIVEVVGPTDPANCQQPGPAQDGQPHGPPGDPAPATGAAFAVPSECLPTQ